MCACGLVRQEGRRSFQPWLPSSSGWTASVPERELEEQVHFSPPSTTWLKKNRRSMAEFGWLLLIQILVFGWLL